MEQTFHCDLCDQEIPWTKRSRDETIFAEGWAICAHCEPELHQRLAQIAAMARQQVDEHQELQPNDLSSETKRKRHQQKEPSMFPHIQRSVSQPVKSHRNLIDSYTASYMRWQNKAHVLEWLDSFQDRYALRPVFLDTDSV